MKTGFFDKLIERVDRLDPAQVQDTLFRLLRERGFMESVFQAMQEGVLVLDLEGTITYLNASACTLFGMNEDQALGQSVAGRIHGLDWEVLVEERRVVSRDLEVTYPDHRFLNFYLAPIGGGEDESKLVGYVMLVRDVTRDRQVEERKLESDRESMMTLLAAGVAHELGNPLNSLTIHLQLLERKMRKLPVELRDELGGLVKTAQDEIKRLDFIIDQFLHAVRPTSPQREWCDINRLVEDAVNFLRPEFEANDCEIRCDLEAGLPAVEVDPNQITQALYNVLRNAMQATQQTLAPVRKVAVATSTDDVAVSITVRDNGPGIPSENMGKIFQPYFTTKAGGTGLGLMIVRRIVRDHGGDITLDSQRDRGMNVVLNLPLAQPRMRYLEGPDGSIDEEPMQHESRRRAIDVDVWIEHD